MTAEERPLAPAPGAAAGWEPPQAAPAPAPEPLSAPPPGAPPWGAGATLLIALVLVGGYLLVQLVTAVFAAVGMVAMDTAADPATVAAGGAAAESLLNERLGLLFWVSALTAAPLGSAAVMAVAWGGVRDRPAPRRELRLALGLVAPRPRHVFGWLLVTAAVLSVYDRVAVWLDRPDMPEFVEQLATTAGWLPGLIFAVVVLAPLFEELAFRGFLVPGLAAGRPGAVGAVLVSAGLFAATHGGQYDLFDLSFVFALGL
ncbi:MAG TPA: CPBP family intramembrane glutamic endopeptidase, partial [Thermoanaerobaculia bacterium]|nr:CPBP family intramembrane glutamic endopeptidase [Thermoanaerobaculia bacterium]